MNKTRPLNLFLNLKLLIIILFSFLNIASYIYSNTLYKNIIDNIKLDKTIETLILSIFKLSLIYVVLYISNYILELLISNQIRELFNLTIKRMLNYNIDFYRNYSTNHINQIWIYMGTIESLIEKCVIDIPKNLIFSVYYAYLIYLLSFKTLSILLLIILVILLLTHPLYKLKLYYQKMKLQSDIETKNSMLEVISNIELVKINNKQEYEINKIIKIYENYYNYKIQNKFVSILIEFINIIINNNLVIIITFIGLFLEDNNIAFLAMTFKNFYNGLIEIKDISHSCKKNYTKLKYIYEIICYPGIENLYYKENNYIYNKNATKRDSDEIKFENITFKYPNSNNYIFQNVNFNFKKDKINIITGKNGFGKSTLVKLLLKMYEPSGGNIFLFGENIKYMSIYEIRSKITYVLQDPLIFNDTVLYNIKYGNDEQEFRINETAESLGINEWLNNNKHKKTGFNGKECSGGENKRIQLMNTLCRKPKVIIFDEPSNHLDDETIMHFIDLLNFYKKKSNTTIIMITHDSRLFKLSDNLIKV